MKFGRSLAVSKLAAYAEDPVAFVKAGGGAYNAKAARLGTAAHARVGAGPNKALFIIGMIALIAALIYFKILPV
jgi:hypothetical protein